MNSVSKAFVAVTGAAISTTQAAIVIVNFSGTIIDDNNADNIDLNGTATRLTYTIDTAVPPTRTNRDFTFNDNALVSASGAVGTGSDTVTYDSGSATILVADRSFDLWRSTFSDVTETQSPSFAFLDITEVNTELTGTPAAFAGVTLDGAVEGFDNLSPTLWTITINGTLYDVQPSSVTLGSVPEPSSILLIGLAGFGVLAQRRRGSEGQDTQSSAPKHETLDI